MKEREKAVQQAMTVGFAIRVIESTGRTAIEQLPCCKDGEALGKLVAEYAWACAEELMKHYPDVPSEQPQAIDFPMISPVRPS